VAEMATGLEKLIKISSHFDLMFCLFE